MYVVIILVWFMPYGQLVVAGSGHSHFGGGPIQNLPTFIAKLQPNQFTWCSLIWFDLKHFEKPNY